jgi:hypothetical protein
MSVILMTVFLVLLVIFLIWAFSETADKKGPPKLGYLWRCWCVWRRC